MDSCKSFHFSDRHNSGHDAAVFSQFATYKINIEGRESFMYMYLVNLSRFPIDKGLYITK